MGPLMEPPAYEHEAFRLYKANAPFAGEQCFADFLNGKLGRGDELIEPWASKAAELQQLILQSKLNESVCLYRATLDAFVARYVSNKELVYPAFMSTTNDETSIQRHFSSPFRGISAAFLRIECPAGTPALNMESDPSFGGHEREFLLPRNSQFEIADVTETSDQTFMARVMSPFYASGFSSLKIYELRYRRSPA